MLPASIKCSSVGNRLFTRGDTFDRTIVKHKQTYRITIRRIRRPRSSCKNKCKTFNENKEKTCSLLTGIDAGN